MYGTYPFRIIKKPCSVVEETNGTRAESTDPGKSPFIRVRFIGMDGWMDGWMYGWMDGAMDGIDRHFALPSQDRMTVWHGLDKKSTFLQHRTSVF
jgi:hypothetical protein